MSFKWVFIATVMLLFVSVAPSYALFSGKIDSFSADNVKIDSNGKVINTAKLYVTEDAVRIDGIPAAGMGGVNLNLSMLILKKQNKSYFYNHDKKLMFEAPADEKDFSAGYKALDNIDSEKMLGKETVSGYKCVKKEVITSTQVMGQNMKFKLVVWESDKFEMPLRTMDEDGDIQEMRNINTDKPSKKLFQPISGYKKVDNMMAVMGMDFGAMMSRENDREEEEEEEAQTMPNFARQNPENMDVNKMMEQMSQAMGNNMSSEKKAQFMQTMTHAMNQAKETKEGPGAAKQIWQTIPKRPGDKIGAELKTTHALNVTMGTNASLTSVFNFYKNKLTAKGWKDQGMYLQNDEGSMHLTKGQQSLTISSAENPGIKGNFSKFYMMQLQGPNI